MIVQIKCTESTYCMGTYYRAGEVYFIDRQTANALGSSVEIIAEQKEVAAPPKNKMLDKQIKNK